MGRLSGFKYVEVIRKLKKFGFTFQRQVGSHQLWYNKNSNRKTVVPKKSRDMKEGTLRAILKQADITPDEFLKT